MKLTPRLMLLVLLCASTQAVTLSSPSPSPVPLQTSVLATLANSMPMGSWAQLNTINIGPAVGTGPTAGNRIVFGTSGVWDETHQTFSYLGDDHLPSTLWHIQYTASNNIWTAVASGLTGQHGYDGITINPFSEELYFNVWGDASTGGMRAFFKPFNLPFTLKTTAPVTQQVGITRGVAWWKGPFTGAGAEGALMFYNDGVPGGQIQAYDPVANTWFFDRIGFGGQATYSGVMEYNELSNLALLGSGNANAPQLWKLSANRSITTIPNLPFGVGSTTGQGNLVADPVNGGFLAYGGSKGLWYFSPPTNTWTRLPDAPAYVISPSDNASASLISAPLWDLKVVFYVHCVTSSCAVSIYKPIDPALISDFGRRCSEPGVFRCIGLDTAADIAGGYGSNTGVFNDGAAPPLIDPTIKASGVGSLKFTIPSNTYQNTSGSYFANFSPDLSIQFGANSTFYYQWRQRFDPNFLNTHYLGSKGWKQSLAGTGDTPGVVAGACSAIEVVTQNTFQRGFPQMYNSCTGSANRPIPYWPFEQYVPNGTDLFLENARTPPYCLYSQQATGTFFPPTGNCFGYSPDEWMTFQVGITVGSRVNDEWLNSKVKLWIARDGQPSQPVFDFDLTLVAGLPTANERFGKIWLTPYQTDKDPTQTHPVAYTWYDELIISRNKISDPGTVSVPPSLIDLTPPTVNITTP